MRINVSRLPYLLQIARSGGVLAAAEAMNLTPSAVSQQLASLEREIGVPLVERSPRGIVPNSAGRELIELAETIEREVNEAALRVGSVSAMLSGRIRLGGFQSFISNILAPLMPAWRAELAGVQLDIVEADPRELMRGLRSADFDIIAIERDESVDAPPLAPGTQEVALLDDPWTLVVPAGTQASMGVIELDNLRLPWLEVDGAAGALQAIKRVRGSITGSSTASHRYATHQTALSLVAAGEGVTMLPQLALRDYALTGIETHDLPGLGVRHITLRFRAGRQADPAVMAAVDLLRTHVHGPGFANPETPW